MTKFEDTRNEFAVTVANFVLRTIATKDYCRKMNLLLKQGLYYADFDDDPPYIGRKDGLKRG